MSGRPLSANPSSSTTVSIRQDSQQSFVKKPPSLNLKMPSQDGSTTGPLSASSGQNTPPIAALAAATLPVDVKKLGHRRVDEQTGQVTYKKKTTSDLMKAIQLGIGQSVGSLTSKPTRDVLMQDFSVVESMNFPENGSNQTPAHRVGDFRFKTYAPIAFRYFRELFGIQTDDFLISLTSLPLTELSNPGASGSVFFITEDDEFIVKTVQHKEADFLQKLLPGYYMNLNQNPRTLLPKFYGLYCLQSGGKNIRLCVMNNLLPAAIRKSEKYDLKGSTYKRKASKHEIGKSSPTFKDLDFKEKNPEGIILETETYEALMKTIKRDCMVLESFKIMDYSLLMCMYNVDDAKRQQQTESQGAEASHPLTPVGEEPGTSTTAGAVGLLATPGAIQRGRSTKHRLAQFSTAMESIQADADPVELEDEDVPPGGIPSRNGKGERLLLYCGVIDILQSYRLKKKLEHGFKSIVYDGDTISVHRPSYYAQRFQSFFETIVFKKTVSLQMIKKAPALQQVQSGHNYSAMRSPSKKKSSATRQRSFTDPSGADAGASAHPETEGALLHKNKPDLIPQVSVEPDDSSEPSSSTNAFAPQWSASTLSSNIAYNSSSASTVIRTYPGTHSKDHDSALSAVKESEFGEPPENDDPLPPYSEHAPSLGISDLSGGARSKQYHLKPELSTNVQPGKTVSAPSVLVKGKPLNSDRKSSFRHEQTERVESKKGVRFSSTHSDEEEITDELLTNTGAVSGGQAVAAESEDEYRPLKPLVPDLSVMIKPSQDNCASTDEIVLQPEPITVENDTQPINSLEIAHHGNNDNSKQTISNTDCSLKESMSNVTKHSANENDSGVSFVADEHITAG